jgi:outer membrane protein assembly factor BamB
LVHHASSSQPKERDFIKMATTWAALEGDILYVSHAHRTYAKSSNGHNAYVSAIDLATGQLLWRSQPLVSNAENFVVKDDAIITGYGFTSESDFLYVLNKRDGEVAANVSIRKAPTYLAERDGKLFVRTYDTDMVFTYSGL